MTPPEYIDARMMEDRSRAIRAGVVLWIERIILVVGMAFIILGLLSLVGGFAASIGGLPACYATGC